MNRIFYPLWIQGFGMPQCIYSNTTHGMKSRCKLLYEMLLSALKKANSIHPSGFAESVTKNSRSSLPKPKTFQQEKYQLWIELPQKLKPSRHASKSDKIIITTLPTSTNWTGSPVQKHHKTSFCGGLKCVIQRGILFPRYTALPMYATLHVYSMYAVHANFIEAYTHTRAVTKDSASNHMLFICRCRKPPSQKYSATCTFLSSLHSTNTLRSLKVYD